MTMLETKSKGKAEVEAIISLVETWFYGYVRSKVQLHCPLLKQNTCQPQAVVLNSFG